MREIMTRSFRPVLYATLFAFLTINGLTLAAGNYFTLIPMPIEIVVLVSVYLGKPWSFIAVKVWACVLVIAGAAMWLAVLLDGVTHFQSPARAVILTVMLILGLYFLAYAKSALQQTNSTI